MCWNNLRILSCQVLHFDNHHFIFRDSMPQCLLGLILMHETNTQLVAKMSWVLLAHFTLCFASPRYHNRMAPPCTNGTDHARSQRGCREKRRGSNMRRQKIAVPKPSSTPYSGWRNATLENLLSSTPSFYFCHVFHCHYTATACPAGELPADIPLFTSKNDLNSSI